MTVGDDDVVSASSLVLSSGLSYLLQAAKFFTPWRKILRHGVKISPLSGNLGGKPPILFLPGGLFGYLDNTFGGKPKLVNPRAKYLVGSSFYGK